MATVEDKKESIQGGEFLIRETDSSDVFIPGEFTDEEKMMAEAAWDFVEHVIHPLETRMENGEWQLGAEILKKAGELGLLGISIPEAYGGLGMSFNMSMLMAEITGGTGSFSTTYGAHTGIGTLPILFYGTEAQKTKYVSKLATGEWIGCYCLTEPDAGSDANSGKTAAKLSDDGKHYIINGQKMWISNAGYADVLIVFAKIDDDKNLTAFILEKDYEGITMNEEEEKLGIKGSSTRQVFFNDVKVPVENMLYERQKGFKIAVNILNIGRIKLGVAAVGGGKLVISKAIQYAKERKQFGNPISSYGAIKTKLAKMIASTYASESLNYRAGHNIDEKIESLIENGMEESEAKLKGIEQFAIEASISKVHGSEVIDYVVDEGLQIYGGMGFSKDAPMERAYRDARIARIYEGTNEINRMLMVDMVFKRAMKGELAFMEPAMAAGKELTQVPSFATPDADVFFGKEKELIKNLKKVFLMIGGKAAQSLGMDLASEQEILMNIADIMIEIYAAESALLRTEKLVGVRGEEACKPYIDMTKAYLFDATEKITTAGREAIISFTKGDEQKVMLMGLKRWTKMEYDNIKELRRSIAEHAVEAGKYPFSIY